MNQAIPTFIINLKERTDRYAHTMQEFSNRDEFALTMVDAIRHIDGALGLIFTIQHIINSLAPADAPYIIIAEDDHQFTPEYSKELFFHMIREAESRDADLLLGGVSALKGGIPVNADLVWVNDFTGTQFVILFRKFFARVGQAVIDESEIADRLYATLSDKKYLINPFISTQKEFGYSDATPNNNAAGRVTELFNVSATTTKLLTEVYSFYKHTRPNQPVDEAYYEDMVLPTYIINLPERADRREHILAQFEGRTEFDCKLVSGIKHATGGYGLWQTVRQIVGDAKEKEEDVILICHDDHEFSAGYNRSFFFRNILEAHFQGADLLSGGSGHFDFALPITANRFWVNPCRCVQFIVIYSKFFQSILDEPFDEDVVVDILLPGMTSNKMLIFPFISFQKDFGYSDATPLFNEHKGLVTQTFNSSEGMLARYQDVYLRYC